MKRVVPASIGKCSGVEKRDEDEEENQITKMECQQISSLPNTPKHGVKKSGDLGF